MNSETELLHLWRDFLRTYPQADPVHHPMQCKYYAMLYFYYGGGDIYNRHHHRRETTDSRKSSEKH